MLRMILGSNGALLRSIVTKLATIMLRKYGLNAKIECEDFVVYRDGNELTIHINGDLKVNEQEFMAFLDDKLGG